MHFGTVTLVARAAGRLDGRPEEGRPFGGFPVTAPVRGGEGGCWRREMTSTTTGKVNGQRWSHSTRQRRFQEKMMGSVWKVISMKGYIYPSEIPGLGLDIEI